MEYTRVTQTPHSLYFNVYSFPLRLWHYHCINSLNDIENGPAAKEAVNTVAGSPKVNQSAYHRHVYRMENVLDALWAFCGPCFIQDSDAFSLAV